MKSNLLFFLSCLLFAIATAGHAQALPPNIYADSIHAPFLHGVASFDPAPRKVILWTKIDPQGNSNPINLTWETFADAALMQPLGTGTATASAATDWTAKADVDFPAPSTAYWYRWSDGQGHFSPVGRT
ncbi:MAG TPA: PhoD-like phosphatase N-terminal domain-containing protein, partial [Bacteroidia bacterium]|nr:PhoD-like phosphatase N-terminal domain-containing protein [Bacteroidia bacterium]